ALVALTRAAEQHGSRRHHLAAVGAGSSVLKGAGGHDRDRHAVVLLVVRPVLRPARANHVLDGPALAGGEEPRLNRSWGPLASPHRRRSFRTGRNFCQDRGSLPTVQLLSRKEISVMST